MPSDQAHITNALPSLPRGGERDRITAALIDDDYREHGAHSRHEDLQTVADLRRAGTKALIERGLEPEDATWLMAQLGGAKRGRKPKDR